MGQRVGGGQVNTRPNEFGFDTMFDNGTFLDPRDWETGMWKIRYKTEYVSGYILSVIAKCDMRKIGQK